MEIIKIICLFILIIVVLPLLLSILLTIINRSTKKKLTYLFGYKSQLILGSFGIIIHELSHYIVAVIFRHTVTEVKLLNINSWREGSLGSVSHSYNPKSVYQNAGNFYISLAPIYICSIVLMMLSSVLFDYNFFTIDVTSISEVLTLNINFMWYTIPIIILLFSLIMGGFDLSKEDFNGAKKGIIWVIVLTIITGIIVSFFYSYAYLLSIFVGILNIIGMLFILAFLVSIVVNIILSILELIKRF